MGQIPITACKLSCFKCLYVGQVLVDFHKKKKKNVGPGSVKFQSFAPNLEMLKIFKQSMTFYSCIIFRNDRAVLSDALPSSCPDSTSV